MENYKRLAAMGIMILVLVVVLALGVKLTLAQGTGQKMDIDEPSGLEDIEAVRSTIPIQGRLTDANGNPLNGAYTIHAALYADYAGGTALCSDTDSVAVDNGLFNMYLDGADDCSSADIDGKQLYLEFQVGSDTPMTSREAIYPVPYAWSLRPGAIISDTTSSAILHIENWGSSGRGLRAYALATSGTNYGIVGASKSPEGYGGYFYNNGGGTGLYGEGSDPAGGVGVEGASTSDAGVYAHSGDGIGVVASTENSSHNYGVYSEDNIFSLNFHSTGAKMQVVQNSGETSLETGDVVAFSGIGAPLEANGPPVIKVIGAESANSTAIAGVVYSRYNIETLRAGSDEVVSNVTLEGPVAPGEYMLVVIQGPAQVKASALAGPLQPGDLLSSADQAGYAAQAAKVTLGGVETAMPGTILGKVLEPLGEGAALIYIFVTLQ